jgi:hypothetical protein
MKTVVSQAVHAVLARNDAEKDGDGAKLDAVLSKLDSVLKRQDDGEKRLDSVCAKMDSFEKERADSARKDAEEKERADKARKDAEDDEAKARKDAEEKERQDKARKDAEGQEAKERADATARADAAEKENKELRDRLAAVERQMPAILKDEDRPRFVAAQSKADKLFQAFGDSAGAPRWMNGEVFADYQRRLLSRFQRYSPDWKDKDLAKVDESVLGIAETRIYADAMEEARHPTDLPPNTLRRVESRDPHTDRKTISFVGADDAFWNQFKCFPSDVRAGRFITKPQTH